MLRLRSDESAPSFRQPDSGKLPSCLGRKKIAVGRANVPCRRDARSAAQHHLPAHEFAVVLAQRAVQRTESRIAQIGAARPHPTVPIVLRCRGFGASHRPGFGRDRWQEPVSNSRNRADFLRPAGPPPQPPTQTLWATAARPIARKRRPRKNLPGSPASPPAPSVAARHAG